MVMMELSVVITGKKCGSSRTGPKEEKGGGLGSRGKE